MGNSVGRAFHHASNYRRYPNEFGRRTSARSQATPINRPRQPINWLRSPPLTALKSSSPATTNIGSPPGDRLVPSATGGDLPQYGPVWEIILNGGDGYSVEGESAPDPNIPALENCRKELVGITIEVGLALGWIRGLHDYNFQGGKRTSTRSSSACSTC